LAVKEGMPRRLVVLCTRSLLSAEHCLEHFQVQRRRNSSTAEFYSWNWRRNSWCSLL